MRDPVKYNVKNVFPTQADRDWAHKFLYPDLREPYRLIPHASGKTDVVTLIATARAATRLEREELYKEVEDYKKKEQDEVNKAFDESGRAMDDLFKGVDKVFAPFRKFGSGMYTRIKK